MSNTLLADRYELIKKIGSGGMGNVYQARDNRLDRIVAVKILKSEFNNDENFVRKFRRESLAEASISHPNIVSIYDVGVDEIDGGKFYYIVMEYVDGPTLKEFIKEHGPLSEKQAVNYTIQIAEALKVAHKNNIVHRDIKSQNIMITSDNRVKVTDFGIARMAGNTTMTVTNAVMGSVHYFSPEQARGQKVDYRSDIYSMGVVLYEMLTGEVPFDSENPVSVALMHVQNPMPRPSELNPVVSPQLDQIVLKMTSKKPQDRFNNVDDIITSLKGILLNKTNPGHGNTMPLDRTEVLAAGAAASAAKKKVVRRSPVEPEVEEKKTKKKKSNLPMGILGALVAILLITGVVFGFSKIKDIFKGKGDVIVVENLVGKSLDEAEALAEDQGFILEVLERREKEGVPEDTILSQSVEPKTEIAVGDKIGVVVSAPSNKVSMPDIRNHTISEAEAKLRPYGISITVQSNEYSSSVPEDRIIAQQPKAGAEVERDGSVTVIISRGEEDTTSVVPNLKGVDISTAKSILADQGLRLGSVSERNSNEPEGTIIWQQYDSGNQVKEGTSVNVIISSGPAQELPTPPSGDTKPNENDNKGDTKPESPTTGEETTGREQ